MAKRYLDYPETVNALGDWLVNSAAADARREEVDDWRRSYLSGVAVTLFVRNGEHDEEGGGWLAAQNRHEYLVGLQQAENTRRDFATLHVCGIALMAYEESRAAYAKRLAEGLGATSLLRALLERESQSTYTEMRNFLVGELEARYVVACEVAFARVTLNNRISRHLWKDVDRLWSSRRVGERGWL